MNAAGTAEDRVGQDEDFWKATLRLGLVYWVAVFVVTSLLWGIVGADPIDSAPGKLAHYTASSLITFSIAAILLRLTRFSLAAKAVVCFALALAAAPVDYLIGYGIYMACIWPNEPVFDLTDLGYGLSFAMAQFFGWACLFLALVYSFEVRDRERRLAAVREEALTAQMRALRYQVNPHFLFNTLNSIAGLIEEGSATRAERMVLSLSTFLRTTLSLDPMHDVPLAEELALQEEYLEIERERFSDRMMFSIDVPEEVRGALVPSLILQPLIENAIKHGVGATAGRVEIALRATRKADRLEVSVENDMPVGTDASRPAGIGLGLRNVAERLRARFREEGLFSSGPVAPGRYRAAIDLPLRLA